MKKLLVYEMPLGKGGRKDLKAVRRIMGSGMGNVLLTLVFGGFFCFLFLLLERGDGREKERQTNINV